MIRRFVTTLTILILVIGTVLPAQVYSDDDIGYEGRICRDLGILKGNTGVVDSAYLETRPSRLQAAVMFLRLKGLEQDALSYTGGNNFKDAGAVAWKEGRNVLSYLKDHPELGWIGDGVNFMPFNLIDSKAYYKVLLESLGYKQKIDGDGDFDWNSVLSFAEGKGLVKVSGTKDFTVRSVAIATVEALKSSMKNSTKKLIEYLVEIGEVDKGDAADLDLYSKDMEAAVKTVRAISNSKVEVVFEEPMEGSEAADEELYTIKQLDIKDVSVKNAAAVIIDTSAMNESSSYTLVFNDKSYSFKGLRKDSYAPKLITAECKDTDLVELTFDRVLDNVTAQDTDIYSIKDVGIKSAELDSTNTKVRLTTSGIQSGESYELKISGIKNGDGATTKSIRKVFRGRKDTSAPKLNKLTVLNNVRLLLEFSDSNGLDKATAQEVDNYRITHDDGSLEVEEVQVKDRDGDGLWDSVELLTESQDTGTEYTLIIDNLMDDSVLENRITREIKREFRGKSKDKSGPTVAQKPKAVTDTLVEVEFSDSNALDIESACDFNNYEIDEGLDIEEIRIKDPDDLYSVDGRTVLLITSEMEKNETYTLEISGIQDEFGNEMKISGSSGYKTYRFKGVADDRTPPYIKSVECIDSKTIDLSFDNELDEESAENIANYRVDGLALVTKAVLQEGDTTVRLTVSSLTSDKNHTILLNNIKDVSGNAISNVSIGVLYNGNPNDNEPPKVADIDAVNENEVWIHFEEDIHADDAKMEASDINFVQVGSILEDGTTVVMEALSPMDDEEYEVTSLTGVWDLRGNEYRLEGNLDFYGTDNENEPPEVDEWDQMDVRRFRVVFTEPVLIKNNWEDGIRNPNGVGIDWTAELNPDEEDTDEAYSTVDFISENGDIPADKYFYFNFTDIVTDYVGTDAYDEEDYDHGDSGSTEMESYMEDDEEPYLEYVETITQTHAQIVFSEEMRIPGSYKITYDDEDGRDKTIDISVVEVDSKDKTRVNIFTEDLMSDDYYYILEPQSAAADIAGNRLDIDDLEEEFEGTNIMGSEYIQGVEILNEYSLRIKKSSKIYNPNSIALYELDPDGNTIDENLKEGTATYVNENTYKVLSEKPLLRSVRYKITVDGLEYKFYGGIPNGGLKLELPEGEITYSAMDMHNQNVKVYRANGDDPDVDEEDDHFEIDTDTLTNGELLYLYVERVSDRVIIYGIRVKVEGLLSAASPKEITGFSFTSPDPDAVGSIDEKTQVINALVPYKTDLAKLVPDITIPDNTKVTPGSGIEQDFREPVEYKVTADDGTTREYTVLVECALNSAKSLTGFSLKGFDPIIEGEINEDLKTITATVPYGTDLTSLKASFVASPDACVKVGEVMHVSGEMANDFTNPVTYTVIAQNDTAQNYVVSIAAAPNSEKLIKEFGFITPKSVGIINEALKSINVRVPFGTDVTKLAAVFKCSDNSTVKVNNIVQSSGTTINDFTGPVQYTVVAQDGSVQDYTVTVAAAAENEKYMSEFAFAGLNPQVKGIIDEPNHTIKLSVPKETDLTNLVASFAYIGKSIQVGEMSQYSGTTPNNFSETVKYIITAQDGSPIEYAVSVNKCDGGA